MTLGGGSIILVHLYLQVNGGNLTISGSFGGPGGATFSGVRLDRTGVDNLIAFTSVLDDAQIQELFQSSDHTSLSFYSSVFACASLGEEAYPTVLDKKGNLQNGVLSGGSSDDFRTFE